MTATLDARIRPDWASYREIRSGCRLAQNASAWWIRSEYTAVSAKSYQFMSLQRKAPLWVAETVLDGRRSVTVALGSVHRLEEEVFELHLAKVLRRSIRLRIDQLELVTPLDHQGCVSFRADTDPVDSVGDRDGAVGFDRDLEPPIVN